MQTLRKLIVSTTRAYSFDVVFSGIDRSDIGSTKSSAETFKKACNITVREIQEGTLLKMGPWSFSVLELFTFGTRALFDLSGHVLGMCLWSTID